jgi:hypothetical protein
MNQIIEHNHRLNLVNYRGPIRASFTLCINNRKPVFISENIVTPLIDMLAVAKKNIHAQIGHMYLCRIMLISFLKEHQNVLTYGKLLYYLKKKRLLVSEEFA